MKTKFGWVLVFSFLGVALPAQSQILSPSAVEVEIFYKATFLSEGSKEDQERSVEEKAEFHASHIFGILQSKQFVKKFELNANAVGGLGAPRWPPEIVVKKESELEDGRSEITYTLRAKMLLHKKVAKDWLQAGEISLPLPYDLAEIYDTHCTDEHYNSRGDYWYFYNVFAKGCTYLQKEPYAHSVSVKIVEIEPRKVADSPRLKLLRGDNGNGDLFSIYVIYGFEEDAHNSSDEGRLNFETFLEELERRGFQQRQVNRDTRRPLFVSEMDLEKNNGRPVHVEIKSLLVDTAIESRSTAFAKFFKEAVENADIILYAGHSGLGGNLDIPSLEEKAGEFTFDPTKRQLFFFDSCSSYSYYLDPFRKMKTRKSIDILSYGLPSYFATTQKIHNAFLDLVLDMDGDPSWMEFMERLEKPLRGGSYLINVGGI
jgi:hypothetical protein